MKTKHTWFDCKCNRSGCMFCDGGLGHCTVCDGFEGTLPSSCPGARMTQEQQDRIYAGTLDYRDGQWVNAPSGSVSSHWDGRPGLPVLP